MIPSAIILGLSASLLWSSQCTYFNEASVIYSTLCLEECDNKQVKTINVSNPMSGHTSELKTTEQYASENINCRVKDETISSTIDMKRNTILLDVLKCKSTLENHINDDSKHNSASLCFNNKDSADSFENATNKNNFETLQRNMINQYKVSNCSSEDSNKGNQNSEKDSNDKYLVMSQREEYLKTVSSVTARFFGMFGLIYRTADIWSNLMSYYILQDGSILDNLTENSNCSCGASFCNVESNCFENNLAEPTQEMRNILTGVSVLLAIFSVILVLVSLDEIKRDKEPVSFSFSLAMATFHFIKRKEALFLLPLSAYIGVLQGFYISDFTKSYIACAWGVYHVGLVTIAYGISSAISATVAGFLVKYVGRIPVMMTGALVNAAVNVFLLKWNPLPEKFILFFVAAAAIGMAAGILWSQLRAFYGIIFKKDEEAAFAGFYLWDSVGYCMAFSYSNYICIYMKIYIVLAVSSLGMIGYLKTESIHARHTKQQNR